MEHWDHLEKLLGELYRKEMDNEENVWRSLPFFSATLAVEVAVVNQVSPLVAGLGGYLAWLAALAAALTMLLVAAVLFFLYRSIRPASFRYIASEPELVTYVAQLDARTDDDGQASTPTSVKNELQRLLIVQFAEATANNRGINQRRARARTNAGRLLVASIAVTLVLVALTVSPQLVNQVLTRSGYGQGVSTGSGQRSGGDPAPSTRPTGRAAEGNPATDALGNKGVVDGSRGAAPDGAGPAKAP